MEKKQKDREAKTGWLAYKKIDHQHDHTNIFIYLFDICTKHLFIFLFIYLFIYFPLFICFIFVSVSPMAWLGFGFQLWMILRLYVFGISCLFLLRLKSLFVYRLAGWLAGWCYVESNWEGKSVEERGKEERGEEWENRRRDS